MAAGRFLGLNHRRLDACAVGDRHGRSVWHDGVKVGDGVVWGELNRADFVGFSELENADTCGELLLGYTAGHEQTTRFFLINGSVYQCLNITNPQWLVLEGIDKCRQ